MKLKLLWWLKIIILKYFGILKIKDNKVVYFKEKSKLDEGWINGGFFVMEPFFLNYIDNDRTFLEREPLEKALKKNN